MMNDAKREFYLIDRPTMNKNKNKYVLNKYWLTVSQTNILRIPLIVEVHSGFVCFPFSNQPIRIVTLFQVQLISSGDVTVDRYFKIKIPRIEKKKKSIEFQLK